MLSLMNVIRRYRDFLEPTVAAIFLALWCVAEAGRWSHSGVVASLVLYSLAIAVSRRLPYAALGIIVLVPVLQLLQVVPGPGSTDWPIVLAGFIVTFFVAWRATGALRWITLAVGVAFGAGVGFLLVFVGDWMNWVGLGLPSADGSGLTYEVDPQTGQILSVTAPMNEAGDPNYINLSAPDSAWAEFSENYGGIPVTGATAPVDVAALQLETALKFAALGLVLAIAAWALGVALQFALRRQRDRQARLAITADLAASDADLALLQERSRIAQEVHDVVAHSLALTLSLAEGSKMLRESRGESHDDLQKIADTSRSALVELQGLLEGLEGLEGESSAPQPRLDDLDELVAKVTPTGLDVDLQVLGDPKSLTSVQERSVYRIVQESLTNALKHGGKHAHAAISLDWRGVGLSLNIVSAGVPGDDDVPSTSDAPEAGPEARNGLGLSGMRERARLAGGWLTAGIEPEDDDRRGRRTYVVTAFIPTKDIHAEVPA